jgi:predicted DNA-binding transcriptional regulator YafY
MLQHFISPYVRAGLQIEDTPDAEGWRRASLPIGSLYEATSDFLRLGAEIEVLEPPALRARMAEAARGLGRLYGSK